jgi:hypothetical protein
VTDASSVAVVVESHALVKAVPEVAPGEETTVIGRAILCKWIPPYFEI